MTKIKDLTVKSTRIKPHKALPAVPFNMTMTGASYSGKTCLIANLITRPELYGKIFKPDLTFWFSLSPCATQASLGVRQYDSLYTESGVNILQTLLDAQAAVKKSGKEPRHVLVVLDDFVTHDSMGARRGILTDLFIRGRHANISVILTAQEWKLVPKVIRQSSLSAVVFRAYGQSRKELIADLMCAEFQDPKQLEDVFDTCTKERYNFMLVNKENCEYWHNLEKRLA